MGKIILFNIVTLDGFFEGKDGDIAWHTVDDEFNRFSVEQLESASGLMFGRITYQLMAGYWPTPAAASDDPQVAELMNRLPKTVFSTTLERSDWQNTRIVRENVVEEVTHLKNQPGFDLLIFGSARLASILTQHGLIDEYRLMVSPVAIGEGRRLFQNIDSQLTFSLLQTRTFGNGNVLLTYRLENLRGALNG